MDATPSMDAWWRDKEMVPSEPGQGCFGNWDAPGAPRPPLVHIVKILFLLDCMRSWSSCSINYPLRKLMTRWTKAFKASSFFVLLSFFMRISNGTVPIAETSWGLFRLSRVIKPERPVRVEPLQSPIEERLYLRAYLDRTSIWENQTWLYYRVKEHFHTFTFSRNKGSFPTKTQGNCPKIVPICCYSRVSSCIVVR